MLALAVAFPDRRSGAREGQARHSKPSTDRTSGYSRSSGARGEPDGVSELAVANRLTGEREGATQLTAQLAHDALLALVDMYALPHERGAPTVDAAMAIGGERSDATLQQEALELLDIGMGRGHGD